MNPDPFWGVSSPISVMAHSSKDKCNDICCPACCSATIQAITKMKKTVKLAATKKPSTEPDLEMLQIIAKTSYLPSAPGSKKIIVEEMFNNALKAAKDMNAYEKQPMVSPRKVLGYEEEEPANQPTTVSSASSPEPKKDAQPHEKEPVKAKKPEKVSVLYKRRMAMIMRKRYIDDLLQMNECLQQLLDLPQQIAETALKISIRTFDMELVTRATPHALTAAAVYMCCTLYPKIHSSHDSYDASVDRMTKDIPGHQLISTLF